MSLVADSLRVPYLMVPLRLWVGRRPRQAGYLVGREEGRRRSSFNAVFPSFSRLHLSHGVVISAGVRGVCADAHGGGAIRQGAGVGGDGPQTSQNSPPAPAEAA